MQVVQDHVPGRGHQEHLVGVDAVAGQEGTSRFGHVPSDVLEQSPCGHGRGRGGLDARSSQAGRAVGSDAPFRHGGELGRRVLDHGVESFVVEWDQIRVGEDTRDAHDGVRRRVESRHLYSRTPLVPARQRVLKAEGEDHLKEYVELNRSIYIIHMAHVD